MEFGARDALLAHVARALAPGNSHEVTSLGTVSAGNAAAVLRATGVDIGGHERVLVSNEIRHTMKSHGDPDREAGRGQVALDSADLARIPALVECARVVRAIGAPTGRKGLRLEYTSDLDGHEYQYVELVRPTRIVALKTMRKRKG